MSRLGENLLFALIGIYESWLQVVLIDVGVSDAEQVATGLQFPVGPKKKGILAELSMATQTKSPALVGSFHASLRRHPKYSLTVLNDLLVCYRYFKEMRNALAHNGSVAGERTAQSSSEYAGLLNTSTLGMRHPPGVTVLAACDQIRVELRPLVGFGEVLIRMLVTVDAELGTAVGAESEALTSWERKYGRGITFPADGTKRDERVVRQFDLLGFPRPQPNGDLTRLLKKNGLIHF